MRVRGPSHSTLFNAFALVILVTNTLSQKNGPKAKAHHHALKRPRSAGMFQPLGQNLPNGAADKLREDGALACQSDRQLQPLDGRRGAPDRKRMVIRSPDGAARSVRAIAAHNPRRRPTLIRMNHECAGAVGFSGWLGRR